MTINVREILTNTKLFLEILKLFVTWEHQASLKPEKRLSKQAATLVYFNLKPRNRKVRALITKNKHVLKKGYQACYVEHLVESVANESVILLYMIREHFLSYFSLHFWLKNTTKYYHQILSKKSLKLKQYASLQSRELQH